MFGFSQLEQRLIRDPRFQIAPPAEYGEESPNLSVRGVRNSSRDRVLAVFSRDYGRSLYLFPAAERRRNLLAVEWVKDARVRRVWPDRVEADIIERQPVAFVQTAPAPGQPMRFVMIDEEGVLLNPPKGSRYQLPVVVGLPLDAELAIRRDRVHRVVRLVREMNRLLDQVSEIDVAEPDNLKVTIQMDGRSIVLELGNQHFAQRFRNFVQNYTRIRERLPNALAFDLRLEDRITAVGGSSSVQ
jgi:cell division protein FtsQ